MTGLERKNRVASCGTPSSSLFDFRDFNLSQRRRQWLQDYVAGQRNDNADQSAWEITADKESGQYEGKNTNATWKGKTEKKVNSMTNKNAL